jgi:Kef-type K+ transport system membrane component KefB
MGLGFLSAIPLFPALAPPGIAFFPFALFMAAAMSMTAFPVMARILKERGETQTRTGRLSLTSAAVADVFSWVMLAIVVVITVSNSDWSRLTHMLLGLALLCVILFAGLRPMIGALLSRHSTDGRPAGALLAALLVCALASAYATAYLGVHPVFGAFLFGACLPRDDRLLQSLIERIEHVTILVLMPVFFALAGLNTSADAFVGAGLGNLALILLVAVIGKVVGGSIGARIAGESWNSAFSVGSLMNARGLMELIVMKVGLDAGLIGKPLFTMLRPEP